VRTITAERRRGNYAHRLAERFTRLSLPPDSPQLPERECIILSMPSGTEVAVDPSDYHLLRDLLYRGTDGMGREVYEADDDACTGGGGE
jgi:hypothetical protein